MKLNGDFASGLSFGVFLSLTLVLFILILKNPNLELRPFRSYPPQVKEKDYQLLVQENMIPKDAEENFYRYITQRTFTCNKAVRLGHTNDGGWSMCVTKPFIPGKSCRVYSFGISNDWSFDDAISKRYKCLVRAFDPSLKIASYQRSKYIWFYKAGISGEEKRPGRNQRKVGWKLNTLDSYLKQFNDSQNIIDYLKMDVEYSEWDSLESMLSTGVLKNVKQFGFEIHTPELRRQRTTSKEFTRFYNILSRLEDMGFRKWYWHLNPFGRYKSKRTGKLRSCCYELVYVNINFSGL